MPKIFHAFVNPVSDQAGFVGVTPSRWNAALQYGNAGGTGPGGMDIVLRQALMADANYYVDNTIGSNSNPGTLQQPFLTLQHAWDFLSGALDLAEFNLTINCASSALPYSLTARGTFVGGNQVSIIGAGSGSTTINNVFVAGPVLTVSFAIDGFTIQDIESSPFGACFLSICVGQILLSLGDLVIKGSGSNGIWADQVGDIINVSGNITFAGTFTDVVRTADGAQLFGNGVKFTLLGTPTYTNFMHAYDDGIWIDGGSVYSGSGTGSRFTVETNAVVNFNTPDSAGTAFPGSVVGRILSGGQYQGITDFVGIVANLPTANVQGARCFVTDALTATFGAAPTGGHTLFVPVYNDGTQWLMG